ncbi:MAG: PA14 domain-containing protein [Bacteroidota bacterium]
MTHRKTVLLSGVFIGLFCLSMRHTYLNSLTNAQIIAEGLIAWRAPDQNGFACANCHAPDALDLARFNFTDADIRRRDETHLANEDTEKIIAMVHAIRDSLGLNGQLLDPMQDRPFQPGGQPIAGNSPQERDFNTGAQIFATQLPSLFSRIDSPEKAKNAETEIKNFDLRTQPCGIPFPRISEDHFHGAEHGSLNDWFSDFPLVPKSTADSITWFQLQDTYLANPNKDNFWAMYSQIETYLTPGGSNNAQILSVRKYQSLLLAQHLWREEFLGLTDLTDQVPLSFVEFPEAYNATVKLHDPFFDIGSRAHKRVPKESEYPSFTIDNITGELKDDIIAMRLPWWYLGWTFNPFLDQIGNRHEYFPQGVFGHLSKTSYILHHEFVHTKMDIERRYVARAWKTGRDYRKSNPTFSRATSGFHPGFVNYDNFFFNEAHEQMYQTFWANTRRMLIYLMIEEVNRQCAEGLPFKHYVGDLILWQEKLQNETLPKLIEWEPDYEAENRALVELAINTLQNAARSCNPQTPTDGTGTGLLAEIYDEMDFSNLLESRIDSRINYYQKVAREPIILPAAGEGVAVRWTGFIEPRYTELYEIDVRHGQHCDPSVRILIGGQPIVEYWDKNLTYGKRIGWSGDNRFRGTITLNAGQQHEITVEYTEPEDDQSIRLSWQSQSQLEEVVPATQLYPPSGTYTDPCQQDVSVNDYKVRSRYFRGKKIYSYGGVRPDSTVRFMASESITLSPGFHAMAGSDFVASIETCNTLTDEESVAESWFQDKSESELQTQFTTPLTVFPNPTADYLQVTVDGSGQLMLMNAAGQMLLEVPVERNRQLNLSAWDAGIYFLIYQKEDGAFEHRKVIKG